MCGVGGVTSGGVPMQQMPPTKTDVAGESGPPTKTDVAGSTGGGLPPTDAASQATAGADAIGSGPVTDIAGVLQQLIETLQALVEALSAQVGGGGPLQKGVEPPTKGGGELPPTPPPAAPAPSSPSEDTAHTH